MAEYIRCKHKKTGEERVFHRPVFESAQHQYKFIEYTENPNAKQKKTADMQSERLTGKPVDDGQQVVTAKKSKEAVAPVLDQTVETLKARYKELSGKDADKRWGVAKLTEKIKEHEPVTV